MNREQAEAHLSVHGWIPVRTYSAFGICNMDTQGGWRVLSDDAGGYWVFPIYPGAPKISHATWSDISDAELNAIFVRMDRS